VQQSHDLQDDNLRNIPLRHGSTLAKVES
jgi:hypothetical protein